MCLVQIVKLDHPCKSLEVYPRVVLLKCLQYLST